MKTQLPNQNDLHLWEAYLEAHKTLYEIMQDMRDKASDYVALIRYGLSRSNPGPAIAVLENKASEDLKPYLDFLLERASYTNAWGKVCAELLFRLPHAYLIENIEREADILLSDLGDEEQYGKLLLMFIEIDSGLAERLAQKALAHSDPAIQQIGHEYFDKTDQT